MSGHDFVRFGGSLTANVLSSNPGTVEVFDPDTLVISMKRGERRVANDLHKAFGGFKRVVIDVDGERHEFGADSLIRLLEGYEGARDTSRYAELFGTPERAARTIMEYGKTITVCVECLLCHDPLGVTCEINGECPWVDEEHGYDALLEWLRGDA